MRHLHRMRDINVNLNYFKRKEQYFGKLMNKKIVKQINLKDYIEKRYKKLI